MRKWLVKYTVDSIEKETLRWASSGRHAAMQVRRMLWLESDYYILSIKEVR